MRTFSSTSIGLALLLSATAASAQGYQPANSLPWPLYRQDAPNTPREALGNAFGEFQGYGSDPPFAHSGIDIRGVQGDIVRVAADGKIWVTVSYNYDECTSNNNCRIYIYGADNRYIYYYSHLALKDEHTDVTAETREKIILASKWQSGTGDYTLEAGTDVTAGTTLSRIGKFNSDASWSHLHFAIIDATENFDAINPLTALNRTSNGVINIIDDERPEISSLDLFNNGGDTPIAIPNQCTPVSGNLDLAATVRDTFYTTNPTPNPVSGTGVLSSFGIYEASYLIKNVFDPMQKQNGTWYRFDRAPLECAGPNRGLSCPTTATLSTFAQHSFLQPSAGISIAESYTPVLFASGPSTSEYGSETGEKHVLLLTHSWGQANSWNSALMNDGWYQLSAVATDADGNSISRSRFVAVDNHGAFVGPGDVYIRDNKDDIGALPSTLGGQPFWRSPDIFILPSGSPMPGVNDNAPNTLLVGGTAYDVYLRVHNDSCKNVNGLKAQIYSAIPAMLQNDAQWSYITPSNGTFVAAGAESVAQNGKAIMGPYPWTPTVAEATANEGHRCMLAKITSTEDPLLVVTDPVKDNNNIAQKNIQFDTTTSFEINNPDSQSQRIDTEMRCNGFPINLPGALLELTVKYNSTLYNAWKGAKGAVVTQNGTNIFVRFTQCNVKLPTVSLPAQTRLPAKLKGVMGTGGTGEYTIDLSSSISGVVKGGMSFLVK